MVLRYGGDGAVWSLIPTIIAGLWGGFMKVGVDKRGGTKQ